MTQFLDTSTSLPFDPRSNAGESGRQNNQSPLRSSEDNGFSRALDDSGSRSDVRRDDAQTPAREISPQENNLRSDRADNSVEQNDGDQSVDAEISATENSPETLDGSDVDEQSLAEQPVTALANAPALFDPFSLLQQLETETTQINNTTPTTQAPLLASSALAGFLPSGEASGSITTPQQNIAATLLDATVTPQLNQAGQNIAAQANNALTQVNNFAGSVSGETFETVLSTQLTNGSAQAGNLTPATSNQVLPNNLIGNPQQNIAASSLQSSQLGDVTQQITAPNATANFTSAEGEQFASLASSNQTSASPSQQLASLLSGSTNPEATLATQSQLANTPLQQAPVQLTPTQQASQPLAQFANAAFANDTLPAFTAQISRNFAAGQDAFNVRLNPSELGRVDVRVITNDDGTVSTQIRVERSETLDLFQRDIRALERTLQQSGVKLGSDGIDLSLKDNGTDQGGNNQAFDNDFDDQGEHAQNNDPALEADDANQHLDNDSLLVDDLTGDIPLDQVQTIYARYQPGQLNIRV